MIFAERKFVATPLTIGLRIGGAAEFGGLRATPNLARSRALVRLAKVYLPGLEDHGDVAWSGHRPATPDTLPVISRSPTHAHILYVFGHGTSASHKVQPPANSLVICCLDVIRPYHLDPTRLRVSVLPSGLVREQCMVRIRMMTHTDEAVKGHEI
ncbi:NAD(P)/FAD-dependent oxidoreductase [Mesorhizobium sp. A623]